MKKFVNSAYRILKFVILLSGVGSVCCIAMYNLTGRDSGSCSAFFASFLYSILMFSIPIAWAMGRLKITLEFEKELEQKGEEK